MLKRQYPTAKVATFKLGEAIIEGLKLEDGTYAITAFQILKALGLPIQNASRTCTRILAQIRISEKLRSDYESSLKTIQGEISQKLRYVSSLEVNQKSVPVLDTQDCTKIIVHLAHTGNEIAYLINLSLVECSLKQLMADAFGDIFSNKEREEYYDEYWDEVRRDGRWVYINMRKEIDGWIIRRSNPEFYQPCLVPNTINAIYKAIFGRTCQELRESWGISKTGKDGLMATREAMTKDELLLVQQFESYVTNRVRSKDINPLDAVDEFKRILVFKPVTR